MKTLFVVMLLLLLVGCASDKVQVTKTHCISDGVYSTCTVEYYEE